MDKHFDGYQFIVVDTGGIHGDEEGIDEEMAKQSLLAVDEADVVLFLVDARDGVTVVTSDSDSPAQTEQKSVFGLQ